MNRLKHLNEERAKIEGQMQSIFDLCEKENRSRTEEERKQWNDLKVKRDAMDMEIKDLEEQAEINKRAAGTLPPVSHQTPGKDKFSENDKRDLKKYKIGRALNLRSRGKAVDGVEAEVDQEAAKEREAVSQFDARGLYIPSWLINPGAEKRDVTIGTESGDIMDTKFGSLIDILAPKPIVGALGVNFITGLTGDYQLPRISTAPSFAWQTEQGASTETTPAFDNVKLTPKRVSAYLEWSNQAQIQTAFNLEGQLRRLLNQYLGLEWDKQTLQGDGTSNKPTGILYTSGVGSVSYGASVGGAPTWATTLEYISDVETANAPDGSLAYVSTPLAKAKMMSTPKVASTDSVMIMQSPNELAGYKFVSTNQMPSTLAEGASGSVLSGMIFGNFSECNVGFFGGVNLIYDNITGATTGTQRLYIEQFMDVKLNHPASFSVSVDMVTT